MAYQDAHQSQKTTNAPETGLPLLQLVRLLAQLAAREAFEHAAAGHVEPSGRCHSELEDDHEAED